MSPERPLKKKLPLRATLCSKKYYKIKKLSSRKMPKKKGYILEYYGN
jgi:hypothetical protein